MKENGKVLPTYRLQVPLFFKRQTKNIASTGAKIYPTVWFDIWYANTRYRADELQWMELQKPLIKKWLKILPRNILFGKTYFFIPKSVNKVTSVISANQEAKGAFNIYFDLVLIYVLYFRILTFKEGVVTLLVLAKTNRKPARQRRGQVALAPLPVWPDALGS